MTVQDIKFYETLQLLNVSKDLFQEVTFEQFDQVFLNGLKNNADKLEKKRLKMCTIEINQK